MVKKKGTKLNFRPLGPRYWLGDESVYAKIGNFFEGIRVPQEWIQDKLEQVEEFKIEKEKDLKKFIDKKSLDFKDNAREYFAKLRYRGGMAMGNATDKAKTFIGNNKLFSLASFGLLFGPTIGAIALPI